MAYGSGTINTAASGQAFHDAIAPLLTTAGFTLVDSGQLSESTTENFEVYGIAAGSTVSGTAWYVAIAWATTGSQQRVKVFSGTGYTPGTHTISGLTSSFIQLGQPGGMANYGAQADGSLYGSVALPSLSLNSDNDPRGWGSAAFTGNNFNQTTLPLGLSFTPPSSAWAYWASVQPDSIAIGTLNCPGVATSWASWTCTAPFADFASLQGGVVEHILASSLGISGLILPPGVAGEYGAAAGTIEAPRGPVLPVTQSVYYPAEARLIRVGVGRLDSLNTNEPNATQMFEYLGGNGGYNGAAGVSSYMPVADSVGLYQVNGGSIGDTVEISGVTYVLIPVPQAPTLQAYYNGALTVAAKAS